MLKDLFNTDTEKNSFMSFHSSQLHFTVIFCDIYTLGILAPSVELLLLLLDV